MFLRFCPCGCGTLLSKGRKACDAELRKQNGKGQKYDVIPDDYPQVEVFVPWTKRPKPILVSPEEQARIDAEARQRDAAAHQRHMAQFGMVVRKGKDLAGKVRRLTPAEIAELQGRYQPPQKRNPVLLPYMGENME